MIGPTSHMVPSEFDFADLWTSASLDHSPQKRKGSLGRSGSYKKRRPPSRGSRRSTGSIISGEESPSERGGSEISELEDCWSHDGPSRISLVGSENPLFRLPLLEVPEIDYPLPNGVEYPLEADLETRPSRASVFNVRRTIQHRRSHKQSKVVEQRTLSEPRSQVETVVSMETTRVVNSKSMTSLKLDKVDADSYISKSASSPTLEKERDDLKSYLFGTSLANQVNMDYQAKRRSLQGSVCSIKHVEGRKKPMVSVVNINGYEEQTEGSAREEQAEFKCQEGLHQLLGHNESPSHPMACERQIVGRDDLLVDREGPPQHARREEVPCLLVPPQSMRPEGPPRSLGQSLIEVINIFKKETFENGKVGTKTVITLGSPTDVVPSPIPTTTPVLPVPVGVRGIPKSTPTPPEQSVHFFQDKTRRKGGKVALHGEIIAGSVVKRELKSDFDDFPLPDTILTSTPILKRRNNNVSIPSSINNKKNPMFNEFQPIQGTGHPSPFEEWMNRAKRVKDFDWESFEQLRTTKNEKNFKSCPTLSQSVPKRDTRLGNVSSSRNEPEGFVPPPNEDKISSNSSYYMGSSKTVKHVGINTSETIVPQSVTSSDLIPTLKITRTPLETKSSGDSRLPLTNMSPTETRPPLEKHKTEGTTLSIGTKSRQTRPLQTQSPEGTKIPLGVKSYVETIPSLEIQSPVKTKIPLEIQSPVKTKIPLEIQSPVKTKIPLEIQSPVKTKMPLDTQSPLKTKTTLETRSTVKTKLPQGIKSRRWTSVSQDTQSPPLTTPFEAFDFNKPNYIEMTKSQYEKPLHEVSKDSLKHVSGIKVIMRNSPNDRFERSTPNIPSWIEEAEKKKKNVINWETLESDTRKCLGRSCTWIEGVTLKKTKEDSLSQTVNPIFIQIPPIKPPKYVSVTSLAVSSPLLTVAGDNNEKASGKEKLCSYEDLLSPKWIHGVNEALKSQNISHKSSDAAFSNDNDAPSFVEFKRKRRGLRARLENSPWEKLINEKKDILKVSGESTSGVSSGTASDEEKDKLRKEHETVHSEIGNVKKSRLPVLVNRKPHVDRIGSTESLPSLNNLHNGVSMTSRLLDNKQSVTPRKSVILRSQGTRKPKDPLTSTSASKFKSVDNISESVKRTATDHIRTKTSQMTSCSRICSNVQPKTSSTIVDEVRRKEHKIPMGERLSLSYQNVLRPLPPEPRKPSAIPSGTPQANIWKSAERVNSATMTKNKVSSSVNKPPEIKNVTLKKDFSNTFTKASFINADTSKEYPVCRPPRRPKAPERRKHANLK